MEHNKIIKHLPLLILLGLIGTMYATGFHNGLNLESLQAQKTDFKNYAASHSFLAGLIFSGIYIGSVALSLPIATILTLLGGFLFGKWIGTLLVVTSATIGACIIFIVARTSLGSSLREKAGDFYQKAEADMNDNAISYLLFLRLVPVFPFFLVNILPALFNIPLRIFALTTFLGIIPGSFIYVNLGQTLGDIETLKDLVSPQTLLSLGLIGGLALIPVLHKKIKAKQKDQTAP